MSNENSGLIPVTDHELFQATTARGFEPGQVIFGRFVLTRVLGRGGMGIVWLAHDKQLEQDVAIKVLPDVVMHDREAVTDMKRETKRSLQLNHHNIVRIYDFNQDEIGAGISMEFVDGETLSAAKTERPHGCFDVEEVGPWMEQICEALAYAHGTAKIVHRDLKPANIMLSKTNTIKVTDFGIARSISDSVSRVSMRHASAGTMVYMSPQQSTGARSSSSDDIYALGATIYDLLTGKPPFYSGNIQHQLESITPPRMSERRLELERQGTPIPEFWEKAVAACLEKQPSKRPASVQELAHRLNLRVTTPVAPVSNLPAPAPFEATGIDHSQERSLPAGSLPPPNFSTSTFSPQIPAPLPPPSWFTPARMRMVGIGAGCIALLVGGATLVSLLSKGHGSVAVATIPPGATVTIGTAKMTSPATFDEVVSGNAAVDIALDGYDPVEIPAVVTKNQRTDLGMSTLKRSTGQIAVTIIPKQSMCSLKLMQSPVAGETGGAVASFPGTVPWQSPPLKTGKYELITSSAGFSDRMDDIEVKRGDSQQIVIDLVKDDAAHLLPPDELAAVNSDQPLPDKLKQDSAAKTRLTAYYEKTFQGYLKISQFELAQSQLKKLSSNLGAATADDQKQLDEDRLIAEKGQGTVSVKTDPPGATISLDGATLTSPAIFNKILCGTKTVQIKLDGYDPVELPAQVNRDNLTDLGVTNLVRSSGAVEITMIPRHATCTLALVHSPAASESPGPIASFAGPDTWKSNALGTGTYALTANADGLPAATRTIEIKKGDNLKLSIDLVKESALHQLSADQIAAVDGDQPIPDAMRQNDAAKASLTAYYQQTFQGYLQLKEFKLADNQLHRLTGDLGVASASDQQQLDQLQTVWLATQKTNLNQLMQQERFEEADAMLTDMETHGPQPELRDGLTKAKTAHEEAVTKALGDIDALESAGNAAGADQAAQAASEKDKLEPRLAMRVANLELAMPSTYDRVSTRVKAMTTLQAAEPALSQDADFVRVLGIFQKNLDAHTSLRSQIATLKKQIGGIDSKVADLRVEQKHNQDKASGYKALSLIGLAGGAAAASQNSGAGLAAGFGVGAIGANGSNDRENDIRRLQNEIDQLHGEQGAKQEQLDQLRQQEEALTQSPISAIQ
jgi:serine/threonine protein kinase